MFMYSYNLSDPIFFFLKALLLAVYRWRPPRYSSEPHNILIYLRPRYGWVPVQSPPWPLNVSGHVIFLTLSFFSAWRLYCYPCTGAHHLYILLMFIFMYCYILSIGFFSCWRLYCSFTVPVQTTPISSEWSQSLLPISVWLHSRMLASFPVHMTSSNQIDPLPGPKLNGYACALKGN